MKMTDKGYQSRIIGEKGLFWSRYKRMVSVFVEKQKGHVHE